MLREEDKEFLDRKDWNWQSKRVTVGESEEIHVIVHEFPLPTKYQPTSVDLLVRIPAKYPETQLDMFWTRPNVTLSATGQFPSAADVHETFDEVSWQRWSRHNFTWRAGIDNLETFFATIVKELHR